MGHRRPMAPQTSPPTPGDLTVPLLFGSEVLVAAVLVVVVLGVAFLVLGLVRAGGTDRQEWEAWLESRSDRRGTTVADVPGDPPA